ncbi:MAG: response regulator, partial [Sedimentisphaerales bacterium]|nr:response regulator [Sedimentisphaerales bacterium]
SQNCHAEIISRYLTQMAVKVDVVSNGEDAIERLVSYSYDYVLLDMSMPELCDESVLEVVQEVGQLFPVVALCHERSKHMSDLCNRIGIKDILTRPIEKSRLDALTIEYCKVAQEVIEANLDLDAQDFFTNIAEEPLLVSADGQVSAIDSGSLAHPIYSSLANDPEMHDVIASFLEMLPDYIESLRQAVDNGSAADIIPVAFDFRDSAGTAGYKELRLLVLALEKAAQANDLETVGQLFTRVVETAGRMKSVTENPAISNC